MINIYWINFFPKTEEMTQGEKKTIKAVSLKRMTSPSSSRKNPQSIQNFHLLFCMFEKEENFPCWVFLLLPATSCTFSLRSGFFLFPCTGSSKDIKAETFAQRFSVSSEILCCTKKKGKKKRKLKGDDLRSELGTVFTSCQEKIKKKRV